MKKSNDKQVSFEEKELVLLREAVDKAETKLGKKMTQSADIINIIKILEDFLRKKKLVCYGGTAINNILPVDDQFYNKDVEIPDYDFYSPDAVNDAKELANIYAKQNYVDIEVRTAVHVGTFKVFVNFIAIADITQMDDNVFKVLRKKAITKNGILYSHPDYLRLQIYKELSRPDGDVSRWEKIYKRFILLHKHYPFKPSSKCAHINFMRDFTGNPELNNTLYEIVKDTLIDEGLVFIGGYASSLYGRYMPNNQRKQLQHVPDFDVLSENPKSTARIIKENLEHEGFKHVKINVKPSVGNGLIDEHYEVVVNKDTVCFIYTPIGCYSYNTIHINNKVVKVASIDTMLFFLLAFIYSGRPYYDHQRILCMAQYLVSVQANNRLKQTGLLKRFNTVCYGHETTLTETRAKKAEKYKELKGNRKSKEYEKYFLKYVPPGQKTNKKTNKKTTITSSSPSASFSSPSASSSSPYASSSSPYASSSYYDSKSKSKSKSKTRKNKMGKKSKTPRKSLLGKVLNNIF